MAAGPGIVLCHYDTERTESVKNMEMKKRDFAVRNISTNLRWTFTPKL